MTENLPPRVKATTALLTTKAGIETPNDAGSVTRFQGDNFPRGRTHAHQLHAAARGGGAVPGGVGPPRDTFPAQYEPWVMQRGDEALPLDESFVHDGFNKAAYVAELHAAGFSFRPAASA